MGTISSVESSSNGNSSGEAPLQYTHGVAFTIISTATVRGRDTTTLGLFKEPSASVPITPHFTFHISSRLSGSLDRSQFIFLSPLLYTHTPSVIHIHALLRYLCASVSLPFLSQSYLSFSVFSPLFFLLLLTFLRGVSLQWIASFLFLHSSQQYLTARCGSGGDQGF